MAEENAKVDHGNDTVTIIVNAREKKVTGNQISFEQVVKLAYDNNPPSGPNVVITVTYGKGEGGKQGTLLPDGTVPIKNGMIFNVKATDRS
ncbi:MAG TPA: multiubiquitin domain-containing protein [Terriglobia bacterium]|nr:multiubiquitin domain-containing protein [Terriglobia bacterium]